ncbi:MAG: hypothetical protein ACK53Y_20895, partial [bacterium]
TVSKISLTLKKNALAYVGKKQNISVLQKKTTSENGVSNVHINRPEVDRFLFCSYTRYRD